MAAAQRANNQWKQASSKTGGDKVVPPEGDGPRRQACDGIGVTPGLAVSAAVGLWLMFTRLTLCTEGGLPIPNTSLARLP